MKQIATQICCDIELGVLEIVNCWKCWVDVSRHLGYLKGLHVK